MTGLLAGRLIAIIAVAWSTSAMAEDDPCFSKADICAYAKEVQATLAPSLPMVVSSNITLRNVAAVGPRIVFGAMWAQTNAEVEARILDAGVSRDVYVQKMYEITRNYVCNAEAMAAFVGDGGEVQYVYMTRDNFPVASPLVAACR